MSYGGHGYQGAQNCQPQSVEQQLNERMRRIQSELDSMTEERRKALLAEMSRIRLALRALSGEPIK